MILVLNLVLKVQNGYRASFMQPGTALIEIAWPSGHWNFMYATPGMVSFLLQVNPT